MTWSRLGVYYLPPPGPLADLGAALLGWDIVRGVVPPPPTIPGLAEAPDLTRGAARYGLHATLKPPFWLRPESDLAAVTDDLGRLAAQIAPARADGLRIGAMGGFVALIPSGDQAGLARVAAAMLRAIDHHRAPPDAAEIARRRAAGLTAAEEAHLTRSGYPYVLDWFRLHLTQSPHLPDADAAQLRDVLTPVFQPLLPAPFLLDQIALVGEAPGDLRLIARFPLIGRPVDDERTIT